jgi:hypothetical protein
MLLREELAHFAFSSFPFSSYERIAVENRFKLTGCLFCSFALALRGRVRVVDASVERMRLMLRLQHELFDLSFSSDI